MRAGHDQLVGLYADVVWAITGVHHDDVMYDFLLGCLCGGSVCRAVACGTCI